MQRHRTLGMSGCLPFRGILTAPVLFFLVFIATGSQYVMARSEVARDVTTGQLQFSVIIDGDLAAVNTGHDDFTGGFLFERNPTSGHWQRREHSGRDGNTATAPGMFSYEVALSDDYAIVGAEWHDGFKGAAYIFERRGDGWSEPQKLSPPDLGALDHFGGSVSISGNYAVVGTMWQDLFRGAVYVFRRIGNRWVQHQKLTLEGTLPDTRFGRTVKINGDHITIGAGSHDSRGGYAEPAYLFRRAGDIWLEGQDAAVTASRESRREDAELLLETGAGGDAITVTGLVHREYALPPLLAPADLQPPDTVLATDAVFEDRVEIVWSDVGLDAIVYRILRDSMLISIASSEDTVYVDVTGLPGMVYEYCVVVTDMAGDESAPECDYGSRIVFPPASVSASDGEFDQFVRVTWVDMSSVEAGYLIKRDGMEIGSTNANAEVFDDSTAVTGYNYDYEVTTFDAEGNLSEAVSDDGFLGVILPPLAVSASDGEYPDLVRITWTDQAVNESGYNIYRDTVLLDSTDADVEFYEDTSAQYGEAYMYCVRTRGTGPFESIPVCDEGGIGILPATLNVSASDSTFDDRVEIVWDDPSDLEDGFEILRDGALLTIVQANVTFYKDYTAVPGTTHDYCVIAFTSEGGRAGGVCDNGFRSVVLAPFDVQATDGTFENCVDITWKSASTTAVLFRIFRNTVFIKSAGRDTRSYNDFGGTAGQVYDYSVVAVTAQGDESDGPSDTGLRELRVPTEVKASDEEYEDRIVVSWADNSRVENGYIVYREDTAAAVVDTIGTKGANGTSFTDYEAVPGVTYIYHVAAFDTLGEAWGESEVSSDEGRRVLLVPTNVQATDGEFEDRVEITWEDNSNAEDGYRIYRNSALIGSTDDNFTSFIDLSPIYGQASEYSVAAFDAYGESDAAFDSGNTIILPPASFNASDGYSDVVELAWVDLSTVEQGYRIYRDGQQIATTVANATSYTDYAASDNVIYEYCIQAFNSGGHSETSCSSGRRVFYVDLAPKLELDRKLLAGDGNTGHHFGVSVAVNDNTAIVGAWKDDDNGPESGSAYIFMRSADGTWTEIQKLVAGDGAQYEYFGCAVGISGDMAVVGASQDDEKGPGSGSAYIFTRGANGMWSQAQKITAGDATGYEQFGSSVAISGDVIIVGAPETYDIDPYGSAYIFTLDTDGEWVQAKKLLASDGAAHAKFGHSVAISGGDAIVGAYGRGVAGTAYIFTRGADGEWPENETTKLLPSDGTEYDWFGYSVAISGDAAIVGAYGDAEKLSSAGSAYIFTRNASGEWIETQKFLPRPGIPFAPFDFFGCSVAISGGAAIVGALGDDDKGDASGSAYIYARHTDGGWFLVQKLLAKDGAAGDDLGYSVAIDGGSAFIGTRLDDDKGDGSGSAYIYDNVSLPASVTASDGSLDSRVRVSWQDRSSNEDGFHIYRDGGLIATVAPDLEFYDDFEAHPGCTYEYGVSAFSDILGELAGIRDFGWRPPNGNITGRVATPAGGGVEAISVSLDPQPIRALLLDGVGGYVRIPDAEGNFSFSISNSYTIEAWIKYSGNGGSGTANGTIIAKGGSGPFPFRLSNLRAEGDPGRLAFSISDNANTFVVQSQRTGLNDDSWHHVACVHDAGQDELRIYIDGTLDGNIGYSSLGDIGNFADMFLGRDQPAGSWFGGQLDEVRIWNVARQASDIQSTWKRLFKGEEDGLMAYWPLDGGTGFAITDLCDGARYGTFEDGVYWTGNSAPLDICATTDIEGNYVLANLRYGDETTFEVRPFQGQRQFEPAFKTITLSTGHPVENQVNFIETTSFTVSGLVEYAGTQCAAPNVEILVDGRVRSLTDKNGKYAVSVDNGDHWIEPALKDHSFDPDSLLLHIDGDTSGVYFTDRTTRILSGRVGGGCGRFIGRVAIEISSENNCLLETLTVDSVYSIALPPQKYFVSAEVVISTIPDGLVKSDVVEFFDNLGTREVALTDTIAVLDFIYRAPLHVTIRGLEEWIPQDCMQLTYNGRMLPEFLPVIPQGTVLDLVIEVNEQYGTDPLGNPELCPLDSGTVVVYDEVFDLEDNPKEIEVRNGRAEYRTYACTPSLIVGRVDSRGNDRSFQKAIRAMVVVEGKTPVTATEWALVTGHVAPEGSDFITATSTELPTYILRDPPGDNSYAFLEKGHSLRTTIDYEKFNVTLQGGVKVSMWFGAAKEFFFGIGAGTIEKIEYKKYFDTEVMAGWMMNGERRTEFTLSTKKRFSTSPDELFVGRGGDVFVGAGFNFIFAEVGVIDVEGCEVVRSTSLGFQPDSIATTYAYTERYIDDVLIPELDAKVRYYRARSDSDSTGFFQVKLDNWRHTLSENERLKRESELVENRSFSAGADYSYFHEDITTRSYTETHSFIFDAKGDYGRWSFQTSYGGVSFSIPWSVHVESIGDIIDTTGTVSRAVGYVLSDDNIGDHFTVDIKEDGRYPSPVFDVLAGISSCPYEPWPDPETGEARMVPRDKPQLTMGGDLQLHGIPPDELAVFTLNLSNLSPTQETRRYILREIGTSNPGGAVISANGVWIYEGLLYYVDPGQSQELTMTVGRGPTRYRYEDLAVMVYPLCEWGIWERGGPLQCADTLRFSVTYETPCSDISLLHPKSGWTFNKADLDLGKAIELLLTGYELEIGEDKSLLSVGAQYRRLGTGREGPTEWTDIPADSLGWSGETLIEWIPPVDLKDGIYELRAVTHCDNGRGYSTVSVGTIDRSAPQVFGTPEPSDEELSLGEDISITFNEAIDCGSIDTDSLTLMYLDGPGAGSEIAVETVCDGTTIIITPSADVDPADLEGRWLEAGVADICDLIGNPMDVKETWKFRVRQSVFTWSHAFLTRDVAFRAPGSISVELVNGSDSTANYNLIDVPSWIIGVSHPAGALAPGATQDISFNIQENLEIGSYDGQVVAASEQGSAVLGIHLTVSCHEPVWNIDPQDFEHTMTIAAGIDIDGALSDDPADLVAAFVGSQVRGVSNLEPGMISHTAFLTVYSNRVTGETVRFQVWDADSCKLYNSTIESFAFVSNDRIGSPESPVRLTATNVLPDTVQAIPLSRGWNWFSTYVRAVDMSVDGVLSDLAPAEGDMIKSQTAFAAFDPEMGWVGTLQLLDNVYCYMIKLSEPGTILQEGSPVDPSITPIPVDDGWSWIGYLPTGPLMVEAALEDLNLVLTNGDMVKSQNAFAQYVRTDRAGWFGDLDYMYPGKGYKLYLRKAWDKKETGFKYPGLGGEISPPLAAVPGDGSSSNEEVALGGPGWSVDPNAYQYNITVIAVLNVEGTEWRGGSDIIGAFVGGECRGAAQPVYLAAINRYVVFLMIHGNEVTGEVVTFKAFVAGANAVYKVEEVVYYEADAAEGTVREPFVLNAESIDYEIRDDLPAAYGLSQNYPNPFNPNTTIHFQLPRANNVVLRIYNTLGQEVRTLADRRYEAGFHYVDWDGRDNQGRLAASGVYFYKLRAGRFEEVRKMVLLR